MKTPHPRTALAFLSTLTLVAVAGLSLHGCGGNDAKDELLAYEAAIEDLMGEEERVVQRLSDLRDDTVMQNLEGGEYEPYVTGTAEPFYAKFSEKVGTLSPKAEGLKDVHEMLMDYLDAQTKHVQAMSRFFKVNASEQRKQLTALETEWKVSMQEVIQVSGGKVSNMEVAQLMGFCQSFIQARYQPFLQGTVTAEELESDLRKHLLPRLSSAAESTREQRTATGEKGAAARFAKASADFFDHMANTVPLQVTLSRAANLARESWEAGQARRPKFIEALGAYRESLR